MKKIICIILGLTAVILPAAPSALAADAGETTSQGLIPTKFVLSCTTINVLLPKQPSGQDYMDIWKFYNDIYCPDSENTPRPGEGLNESEDEVAPKDPVPDI